MPEAREQRYQVGILTVSDRAASGDYEDESGRLASQMLRSQAGWEITHSGIVPDELEHIADRLVAWCEEGLNLILTSGGTGFSPRDVTPEATRRIIEREAPGIAEALRADSLRITKHAMLSRAVAGMRGQTLIVNLPGNPKAVRENLIVLLPVLPHALDLLTNVPGTEHRHRAV